MKRALLEPAGSLQASGLIVLAAALLLPAAALVVGAKGTFLLVAVPVVLGALLAIYLASRVGARLAGPYRPTVLAVLLYSAGVIACAGGYAYLALTTSSVVAAPEEIIGFPRPTWEPPGHRWRVPNRPPRGNRWH